MHLNKKDYDEAVAMYIEQGHNEASAHGLASSITYATPEEVADLEVQEAEQIRLKGLFDTGDTSTIVVKMTDTKTNQSWYRKQSDNAWWIEQQPHGTSEINPELQAYIDSADNSIPAGEPE